ncbi:hypothetical protein [Embleya scabrispora]|uniref:hypothetical protein n=1 Tax=Embleya scabrispora TaxID=159449 RepID=UPI000375D2A0|nr:hypothetical protein [Embleya scabrispora]MYS83307.1 hypothetical protein [Streptomyces sp. SID5474]
MEITAAHGYVTIPGHDDTEVTIDLFDWPIDGETLPRVWTAVIDAGPILETGTEGFLRLDTEPPGIGHPFVVIASGDHVAQIRGRQT